MLKQIKKTNKTWCLGTVPTAMCEWFEQQKRKLPSESIKEREKKSKQSKQRDWHKGRTERTDLSTLMASCLRYHNIIHRTAIIPPVHLGAVSTPGPAERADPPVPAPWRAGTHGHVSFGRPSAGPRGDRQWMAPASSTPDMTRGGPPALGSMWCAFSGRAGSRGPTFSARLGERR